MKRIVKSLLAQAMCLWSYIYTYRISLLLKEKRDILYTLWICNFLGEVGEKCRFHYPLQLQGGGAKRIIIGSGTSFQSHCILGSWERYSKDGHYEPEIVIGNDCSIGEYCHITAINRVTIGNGLLTGRFVYIGDNAHGGLSLEEAEIPPARRYLASKGEVVIGNNVWLGDRVSVFSGVKIGDNVIIGAGSIVTHDIPSNSLAVGSPAKVLKQL